MLYKLLVFQVLWSTVQLMITELQCCMQYLKWNKKYFRL